MSRLLLLACLLVPASASATEPVLVGSKKFTESVILGDLVAAQLESMGAPAVHRRELGGTRVLWSALLAGQIQVYPEYTGTLRQELLPDAGGARGLGEGVAGLRAAAAGLGIGISDPLGFNNTYALGMKAATDVVRISELARLPELRLGFSNEFMDRVDGWPALQRTYGLPQTPRGLDHDMAYMGMDSGDIDVLDLYSTDPEIAYYGLRVLEDDRRLFPRYDAVLVYRLDLAEGYPPFASAIGALEGLIPVDSMVAMNSRAKIDKVPEARVAADFLEQATGTTVDVVVDTRTTRFVRNTKQHLLLVGISLLAAILTAIPLGVLAARRPREGAVPAALLALIVQGGFELVERQLPRAPS